MRGFVVISTIVAFVSCMEMRETVERMVMVRTTGSDLQPAATGFIYKKESDGPASVIKMGESEVMEHLSKMYEQPKSFAAPIPVVAGPFYSKNEEDKVSAVSDESKIIPVVEIQDDNVTDHVDGIANEEYGTILEDYASGFGNYDTSLDDYLKSLGRSNDKINHVNGDTDNYRSDNDDSNKNDYDSIHQQNKKDAENYNFPKYKNFQIAEGDENKKENGYRTNNYKHERNPGFQPKYSESKTGNGFQKFFNSDEYTADQDFQNGEEIKGIQDYIRSYADNFEKGRPHESGFYEDGFGESRSSDKQSHEEQDAKHSEEKYGKPSQQYHDEFSFESGKHDGRSYGYEIKH